MIRSALLVALLLTVAIASAHALSVRDFESRPDAEQASYVADFIEKMTADIGRNDSGLAKAIREWFSRTPDGRRFPEGIEKFAVEMSALDLAAKHGKADLSRIQVEGVIVKVIKDRFPPPKDPSQK